MRPVTFRIRDTVGDGWYVLVTVYPTRGAMHEAYRRWDMADRSDGAFDGGWHGLCAVRDYVHVDDDGNETERPYMGRVFLHREALGTTVVVHEMVHAALGLWRRRHRTFGRTVIGSMPREEEFAHIVSDLTRMVVDKLYDRGFYEEAT